MATIVFAAELGILQDPFMEGSSFNVSGVILDIESKQFVEF